MECMTKYLDESEGLPVAHFVAACQEIGRDWDNRFGSPQSGDIRARCELLMARNRVKTEAQRFRDRMDVVEAGAATPQDVLDKLAEYEATPLPECDPENFSFARRVLLAKRAGLRRVAELPPKADEEQELLRLDGVVAKARGRGRAAARGAA